MPYPINKLDFVIDALNQAPAAVTRRRTLRRLTGVRLPLTEATHAWNRILDHKWYLGERLGRDVGLRVAAVDYFENIAPPVHAPSRMRSGGLPATLPMMRSLAN